MTRPCPYCAEAIEDKAIVCKHCGRDFYLAKPLLDEVTTLKGRIASLEQELESLRKTGAVGVHDTPVAHPVPADPPRRTRSWLAPVLCVGYLLLAHAIIVLMLDLRLVNLRIASLVGPFVFGFLFRRNSRPGLWIDALVSLAVAVVSVGLMLAVVARVDGVPILPSGRQESIETAQYITSIALGFFAGALIRQVTLLVWDVDQTRSGTLASLARILSHEIFGEEKSAEKRIKKMEGLLTTSLALSAGVISVVMGLGKIFE